MQAFYSRDKAELVTKYTQRAQAGHGAADKGLLSLSRLTNTAHIHIHVYIYICLKAGGLGGTESL